MPQQPHEPEHHPRTPPATAEAARVEALHTTRLATWWLGLALAWFIPPLMVAFYGWLIAATADPNGHNCDLPGAHGPFWEWWVGWLIAAGFREPSHLVLGFGSALVLYARHRPGAERLAASIGVAAIGFVLTAGRHHFNIMVVGSFVLTASIVLGVLELLRRREYRLAR